MENYKITYFSKETKKIEVATFNSFEDAISFGKTTLENFNTDLITKIY